MDAKTDNNGLNLKNLLEELANCFSKYFQIGIQLDINDGKIAEFEQNHSRNAGRCFAAVISHWLDGNAAPVTWETLIAALKARSVNEKTLAQKLEGSYSVTSRDSDSVPHKDVLSCSSHESQPQSQISTDGASDNLSPNIPEQQILVPPSRPLMVKPVNPVKPVKPLYNLTEDGNVIVTPRCVFDTLEEFGYDNFRPNQERIIMNILSGVSTLAILQVGSGKSLCYQIPAYLYSKHRSPCISLVISPLISLMEDQVQNFPPGLRGEYYHSHLKKEKRKKVIRKVQKGKVDVLLLTPEALMGGALWGDCGDPCLQHLRIAFVCIDEIHCVSEWSHNFRPAYFRIQKALEHFDVSCVLGLTATATHETANFVASCFEIKNIIRDGSILPNNLRLTVSCENDKYQALIDLIKSPKFRHLESMIVYCNRQYLAEDIAKKLKRDLQPVSGSSWGTEKVFSSHGINSTSKKRHSSGASIPSKMRRVEWSVGYYHGGMKPDERDEVHEDFMEGKIHIMVATEAFGVGINKKNIRAIIHYDMPKSIELYVQEAGRAGRDGRPAYCHTFIDEEGEDLYELRHHVYNSVKDKTTLWMLMDKCFKCPDAVSPSRSSSQCLQHESHEVAISLDEMENTMDIFGQCITTLVCYLEQRGDLEIKHITNDTCKLKCSGGPSHLRALAKKVPSVAAAKKQLEKNGIQICYQDEMIFSIREVAKFLRKESNDVYMELSGLQYNDPVGGCGTSNAVSVEFSTQVLYIRSPVRSSKDQADMVCFLSEKIKKQEENLVEKLHLLRGILQSGTGSEIIMVDEATNIQGSILRRNIQLCFNDEQFNASRLGIDGSFLPVYQEVSSKQALWIEFHVHLLLTAYPRIPFTGRSIARIFYGLGSPLFPVWMWRRQKEFWGKFIEVNFDQLCRIATRKVEELYQNDGMAIP